LYAGLRGRELAARLDGLFAEVESVVGRHESQPAGAFGPAFVASLITIVREGVEVILILTMLFALVSKTVLARSGRVGGTAAWEPNSALDAPSPDRNDPRARGAIWWGVAAAAAASLATALALNLIVATAQGSAREILEGVVMLVASGVLFYVSYWLISHAQA
jgi:high-affinity iron transporter